MPKVIAKPLSLTVRPLQVANLCFEVGGILGRSFVELGAKVSAFDFDNVYKLFRAADIITANDPGRLVFDSDRIDSLTNPLHLPSGPQPPPIIKPPPGPKAPPSPPRPFALATLRAETVKAALNKAIIARANAFYTKFENAAEVIDSMRKVAQNKRTRLVTLSQNSQSQADQLAKAYLADPERTGLVRTTINSSILDSKTTEPDAQSISTLHANETVTTKNIEFRAPMLENLARNERAQINLNDEQLSNTIQMPNLARLEEIFKNELASIDADVNQMQVAYLNTILMSPIDGIVTGVYKNPGDPVAAGEPVFRVENNDNVLFVARVICRGPIVVGSNSNDSSMLQIKTKLFDLPDSPVTIEAEVVAARGQGEDDQWEVIAKRSNVDAAGKTIFPLGYYFDYDDTEVAIFGPGEI